MLTVRDIAQRLGVTVARVHQLRLARRVGRQEPTGRRRWLFTAAEARTLARKGSPGRPRQTTA